MACCVGAEHYNWCEDYDIVYIDAEGKEYCIFHAPAECKFVELYDDRKGGEKPALIDAEEFNAKVFERIQAAIDAGEDDERDEFNPFNWNPRCNFAGTIFPYNISFSEYNGQENKYLPSINFSRSQFRGDAYFRSSQFRGYADFSRSQFRGYAYFRNSQFRGYADFRSSQFRGYASFRSSQFRGNADFSRSQFRGYADFFSSQFRGDADFRSSQFRGYASFRSSQFRGYADFFSSQFRGDAYFFSSQFRGDADFFSSQFRRDADFRNAETRKQAKFNSIKFVTSAFDQMEFKGPVYFDGSIFADETSFKNTIFHDYSNFEKTEFKEGVTFKLAFFKEWAYYRNAQFAKKTTFAGAISKESILLESVDLSNFKFAETNIESFKLIDCNWGDERFAPIYDERTQTKSGCNDTTLAEIYRRLKKISRESADEEQTSHWHYREKEMSRKSLSCISLFQLWFISIIAILMVLLSGWLIRTMNPSYFAIAPALVFLALPVALAREEFSNRQRTSKMASKVYLSIYRFISGYGEEPFRAGMLLFILIGLPFAIQCYLTAGDWITKALWYMPLLKVDYEAKGYEQLLKGISVSAITLQAALFGFALRNKLRR